MLDETQETAVSGELSGLLRGRSDEWPPRPDALTKQTLKFAPAQSLNLHLTSSAGQVSQLAQAIYSDLRELNTIAFADVRDVIVMLLVNLYSAAYQDSARYIRFSRRPDDYTQNRYNKTAIGFRRLNRVLQALYQAGLIEVYVGTQNVSSPSKGWQSRMRATASLQALMIRHRLEPEMITRIKGEEVIVLRRRYREKDVSAAEIVEQIDYHDNRRTSRMRRRLIKINKLLANTDIRLAMSRDEIQQLNRRAASAGNSPIDYERKYLRRIFNGDFHHGGRFYHGWWQELEHKKTRARKHIIINGQQTVELDFVGMHFAIFYAELGLQLPDDPYRLNNIHTKEDRTAVKIAANIMINAASRAGALKALRDKVENPDDPLVLPLAYAEPTALIEALENKHDAIRQFFYSGAGTWAQNCDSAIAERIMWKMAKDGIPVLCVHDSFIVAAQHEERLEQEMRDAFEEETGARCQIKGGTAFRPDRTLGEDPAYLLSDY